VAFDDRHRTERLLLSQITPGWAGVIAALHKINPDWGPAALKRGLCELLHDCITEMIKPDAKASLIDLAQDILDALRRMSWEGSPITGEMPTEQPVEPPPDDKL
jgi:hypothetical protein